MTESDELSGLTADYQKICRRLDTLKKEASQDNASARMAFDECSIGLQDCKETLDHYLRELRYAAPREKDYFLHAARQALLNLKESVHDAEIKVKSARPMPPFLY